MTIILRIKYCLNMQQNTKKYWRTDKLGLFDDTGFANNATILKMKCLLTF